MCRRGSRLPALLLSLGVLLGALPDDLGAQSWRTLTVSRQRTGEESLEVDVTYGAGRFRLAPADPGLLYRAELRYDEEVFEPVTGYEDGELEIGTRTVGNGFRMARNRSAGHFDLYLGRDVALDVRMELGAVRTEVELGGLSLSGLRIATGASESRIDVSEPNPISMERARLEVGAADFVARRLGNLNAGQIRVDAGVGDVTLDLSGQWARDAEVGIEMGLGALELRFPRELGVSLRVDSFLVSLDPQGLVKRGDVYYSTDWEDADRRVAVRINAALGDVDVVWVGER